MTARLFIGAYLPVTAPWGAGVARPNLSTNQTQYAVYSPRSDIDRCLQFCILPSESPRLHVVSESDAGDSQSLIQGTETVLLAPVGDASPIPETGFILLDHNGNAIRRFEPDPDPAEQAGAVWPDWRFELRARGLVLFKGVAVGHTASDEPRIMLGDPLQKVPDEALDAWLNPLVLGFRDGLAVRGLPGYEAPDPSDIRRAIDGAVDSGHWVLMPELDRKTRLRTIAWRALVLERDGKESLLDTLLTRKRRGPYPAPLADLAALDAMGGVFHNAGDGRTDWAWAAPDGEPDSAESQLRQVLLKSLALKPASESAQSLHHWRRDEQRRAHKSIIVAARGADPLADRFRAIAADETVGTHVVRTFRSLAKVADDLGSREADALLGPVFRGLFFDQAGGGSEIDIAASMRVVADAIVAPRSGVRVPMTVPDTSDDLRPSLERRWNGMSIDLFESPGLRAGDTLRFLMTEGEAQAETPYEGLWWSEFWDHCIRGHRTIRFRLTGPQGTGEFILDRSALGGGNRLAGGIRP